MKHEFDGPLSPYRRAYSPFVDKMLQRLIAESGDAANAAGVRHGSFVFSFSAVCHESAMPGWEAVVCTSIRRGHVYVEEPPLPY